MTISVNPTTVAQSIAALSVSGVTMLDLHTIPDSAQMICPIFFPRPNEFITAIETVNQSFGTLGNQAEDFTYTLNYIFLYTEIGSGINSFAPYDGLITTLNTTINVILNNDVVSGLVDMKLESITGIGSIDDPAGHQYWGAFVALRCLEFGK